MNTNRLLALLLSLVTVLSMAYDLAAHPHVLIEGRAEVVFDSQKRITAVRHAWRFDEAYSSFATSGLDSDGDGTYSESELAPLAKVNVESLHEFAYFTFLKTDEKTRSFRDPTDYTLKLDGKQLELDFTLPLAEPAPLTKRATLEVYDPEYFVAFTFPDAGALRLVNASTACRISFYAPGTLDAATVSRLAEIPAEQRDLPEDLQDAAAALANHFILECRG